MMNSNIHLIQIMTSNCPFYQDDLERKFVVTRPHVSVGNAWQGIWPANYMGFNEGASGYKSLILHWGPSVACS